MTFKGKKKINKIYDYIMKSLLQIQNILKWGYGFWKYEALKMAYRDVTPGVVSTHTRYSDDHLPWSPSS